MKYIVRIMIFVLILALLVFLITGVLIPGSNVRKYGILKSGNFEILSEKDNTIDVVFLGDSLVYSSVSPMDIWNEYGIASFDCANPAQIIPDSYEDYEAAIKSQHPKMAFVEASMLFRDPKNQPFKDKIAHEFKKFIPIVRQHNNWKKYITDGTKDKWINYNKGFKYIASTEPSSNWNYMVYSDEYEDIPENNIKTLKKFIDLSNKNNIKFILISFPSQKDWNYKRHNSIEKITRENNIELLDLNIADLGIDWTQDTRDNGKHINYRGSKKVSTYVGNYIKNTNLVKDHRNDSNYESWDEAYKLYLENNH